MHLTRLALSLLLALPTVQAMPIPTQGVPIAGDAQQAAPALQQAAKALQAGQLDVAQKGFLEALRADPKQVDAVLGLADIAFRERNETELMRRLQQAEQLAPQRADVQTLLGRVHLGRKDLPKAEAALRKALQLDPKGQPQKLALVDVLIQQRKAAEALKLLEQAQQQEPKNPAIAQVMGDLLASQGSLAEAEKQWRLATELNPKNPAPWMALMRSAKDAKSALALLDEAQRHSPDSVDLLLARSQFQLQAKDRAGARATLERAAKADPKSAVPWLQLGLIDEADGKRGDARRHYLAVLERDPQQPIALNNLVMLGLADNEDPGRLETLARRAVKALPQSAAVHDTLARTLRARRDKTGALAAANEAARLAPKEPTMLLHLAEIQQWTGDRTAAKKTAEQVLALQASGDEATKAKALLAKL